MKLLINSPFYGLVLSEEVLSYESALMRELADLSSANLLIEIGDREQDRSLLVKLGEQLLAYQQITWYVLPTSDRNLVGFRELISERFKVGTYVPTDELIYKCPYLQRNINFGAQLDLLRRLFIVLGKAFVVCDPSAIRDAVHYVELVASMAQDLYPIRESQAFNKFLQAFNELKRD
jgi:hypothetical protein